ncbi:MAG: tRNA (N(6)-L-threonylcarbamoyladenosine(37)-C(2))-methylthiotransferase MtaB [Bacillota bacterium]
MNSVAFHTLGCKVNQYETEAMEEMFEKNGYRIVGEEDYSDIYVINTCTVTNLSDRKSRQFIRKSRKNNPGAIVAVVGCYSQVSPEEVEKIEGVDVIIGTSERFRIVELCEEAASTKRRINIVRPVKTYKEFERINIDEIKSRTRAFVKIQDGCNQFCSYCIIPYARGPIRSREYDDIEAEVKKLSQAGFKEIVLTGIHVASYGKDLKKESLSEVIDKISLIEGIERIRLSSLEPTLIDKDFMETMTKSPKICNHFHLSLQSGSDSVLKRMNRKYNTEDYRERVRLIRKFLPDAGITTDIIVGFPGETNDEFQETMDFVVEIGFSRIHVFKYSPRKGTPAATMENQIHGETKNRRSELLIALGERLSKEFNQKYLDEMEDVLYEEHTKKDKGVYEGYTSNYIRVRTPSPENLIGKIKNTRLYEINGSFIGGTI